MKFIVAIDGTAASGKGTLAKKTANHFGFKYLDTGILYRVVAFYLKSAEIHSEISKQNVQDSLSCLLYTSPSPRDQRGSGMPSSA